MKGILRKLKKLSKKRKLRQNRNKLKLVLLITEKEMIRFWDKKLKSKSKQRMRKNMKNLQPKSL